MRIFRHSKAPRYEAFVRRLFGQQPWPVGLSINAIGNSALAPTLISPAGNVSLPSVTETTIIATPATLVGVPGMNYIPLIIGQCVVLMGATPPTAMSVAARYAGGADFDTQTIDTGSLVANATGVFSIILVGVNVRAAGNGNIGSGAIQVTGNPQGQAVTARGPSTKFAVLLWPGPDA